MLRRSSNLENWIKGDVETWKKKRTIIKKIKRRKTGNEPRKISPNFDIIRRKEDK